MQQSKEEKINLFLLYVTILLKNLIKSKQLPEIGTKKLILNCIGEKYWEGEHAP